jgi:glycosyltransferase involved in cell wall biosynthesis
LIAGDGEDRQMLERAARDLGIGDHCSFLGWRADMPVVYAAMDVLVLSSINEGTPVSLIEGMATGRPVVATAVGGVPDVVHHRDDGLLVPPRDPDALASEIGTLLCDRALAASLGRRAQPSVLLRFDVSRLVTDIESLYSELMGPPLPNKILPHA